MRLAFRDLLQACRCFLRHDIVLAATPRSRASRVRHAPSPRRFCAAVVLSQAGAECTPSDTHSVSQTHACARHHTAFRASPARSGQAETVSWSPPPAPAPTKTPPPPPSPSPIPRGASTRVTTAVLLYSTLQWLKTRRDTVRVAGSVHCVLTLETVPAWDVMGPHLRSGGLALPHAVHEAQQRHEAQRAQQPRPCEGAPRVWPVAALGHVAAAAAA